MAASVDLVAAACRVVLDEWGVYGYGVASVLGGRTWAVLEVVCGVDGSRFWVGYAKSGRAIHSDSLEGLVNAIGDPNADWHKESGRKVVKV